MAALMLLAIPATLSGGVLVALATGSAGSLGAMAGLLAVLAIAVRHAVALAARIRGLQEDAPDAPSSTLVLAAAGDRLAPVLAATAAIALALVPMLVLGNVAGNELTRDAAAVILGGLASSTLLSLFVFPAFHVRFTSSGRTGEQGWPELPDLDATATAVHASAPASGDDR
jgi:Cu/Ag efflux pump CusA